MRSAGLMASGSLLLPQWACQGGTQEASGSAAAEATAESVAPSLEEFGLQLYTLRADLPKDPEGIIRQIAGFGYTQIEGYEGDQGMFWGMGHTGFKQLLDEVGLTMVASHCDINTDFEAKAAQAAEIGMKYLISPWVGPQESLDAYKRIADTFNARGEVCKQNGIRFAYHNHDYSFKEMDGVIPQDYMMENTDPALVDYELDIYWVVTGGADPIAYLEKYGNRFTLCHVKDRMKGAAPDETDASCDLGTGSIDYPAILKIAADQGMQYYIVEQERYDGSTPLESAKKDAEYLSHLVFA